MLPWQIKSILVMCLVLRSFVLFLSIAQRGQIVELRKVFLRRNPIDQLLFRPAVFADCPDIPAHFLQCQAGFQDHHILCPADFYGHTQQGGAVFIGAVKLPHPAQVARGETGRLWVSRLQVFCSGDRSAFLGPAADDSADLAEQPVGGIQPTNPVEQEYSCPDSGGQAVYR